MWRQRGYLGGALGRAVTLLICASLSACTSQSDTPASDARGGAGSSPLAQYPGFGHDHEADEVRFRRQELAQQQAIARCIQGAGFQYTPTPSVVGPRAANAREARGAPRPDPNERYAASLSPAQRTRYYLALYGVPDPNDEENLWDPRSPTGGGCWGEATRAIPGVYSARSALVREFLELRSSIPRDPRVAAAEQRWSECMRARGFSYGRPQSIRAQQDSAAVRGALTPELERRHRQAMEVAPECVTVARLDSITAAVRFEKEAEFVATHKDVLDRHLATQQRQNLPPN